MSAFCCLIALSRTNRKISISQSGLFFGAGNRFASGPGVYKSTSAGFSVVFFEQCTLSYSKSREEWSKSHATQIIFRLVRNFSILIHRLTWSGGTLEFETLSVVGGSIVLQRVLMVPLPWRTYEKSFWESFSICNVIVVRPWRIITHHYRTRDKI